MEDQNQPVNNHYKLPFNDGDDVYVKLKSDGWHRNDCIGTYDSFGVNHVIPIEQVLRDDFRIELNEPYLSETIQGYTAEIEQLEEQIDKLTSNLESLERNHAELYQEHQSLIRYTNELEAKYQTVSED